ncbi:MAG: hypothetical protein ASARMPRED_007235 [Alectoria sarmentosa]|nr:MAG: hypothetical protein ASARMPRED_007235 [Alectoria sarmentosa]
METDVITAEAEMKEQTILETTTKEVPDSGTTDHPVTTGHLEIQAVNEAVRESRETGRGPSTEDLSNGANAAMEDGAEAAAAEARESEKSTSPIIGLTAPTTLVENETIPTHLQQTSNFLPAGKYILLGREPAISAKEEKLWHMKNNLAFRETNLHLREAALFAREQLLERMETAQIQLTDNWKAQVETAYAGLEAEGEDLGAKFRALIALQGMVEGTQAKARGMIGRGGDDEGEDKGA